jgi:hypothetical protein
MRNYYITAQSPAAAGYAQEPFAFNAVTHPRRAESAEASASRLPKRNMEVKILS